MTTQTYYSLALSPLAFVAFYAIPPLILVGAGHTLVRWIRLRRMDRSPLHRLMGRQSQREETLLVVGAAAGTLGAIAFPAVSLHLRLGLLLALPALGAAVGLMVSAMVPAQDKNLQVTASLEPRTQGRYVSRKRWCWLGAAAIGTVAIAVFRSILPERRVDFDAPDFVVRFDFENSSVFYAGLAVLALGLVGLTWFAVGAVVRRSRLAGDSQELELQDAMRERAAMRIVAWSTGAILVLNAAMLTPFSGLMGGILFGYQVVQRANDLLTVALVVLAVTVIARSYRGTSRPIPAVATTKPVAV